MRRHSNQTKRYAIYARCSSDDQAHRDFSTTDVQIELDSQYIREQGGTLAGLYKDDGISGTTLKRKDFQRLLDDAKAGAFDVVVVTYMSRLGRGDSFTVAEYLLKELGVKVEMVNENFTDDMSGHVNKKMTQFVDGMYVEQVRQWTRTKMEAMVKAGYVCGGTLPFGLTKQFVSNAGMVSRNDKEPPKRFVLHPDEAPIVLRAYELFAETQGIVTVQTYLNAVTERTWSLDNVTYLLRNEVYRGVLVFGRWRNEQAHEAIISPELWEKVRAADAGRTRRPKQNPKDMFRYYIRGAIFCPHCGCKMTPAAHPGRTATVPYYECINSFKKHTVGCPVRRVNARTVHEAIYGEIARAAQHPTRMTELIREAAGRLPQQESLPADLAAVTKRLSTLDKQIANITQAVSLRGGQLRPLLQKLESLETERLPLEMKKAELAEAVEITRRKRPDTERICREWSRFTTLWEAGTDEEREEIMQAMVVRVEMNEKEEGTCDVALLPQAPSSWLELTPKMGAGRFCNLNRLCSFRPCARQRRC